jgi:hypothetical protein
MRSGYDLNIFPDMTVHFTILRELNENSSKEAQYLRTHCELPHRNRIESPRTVPFAFNDRTSKTTCNFTPNMFCRNHASSNA